MIRRDVSVGQTIAASLQAPTLFTIARDLRRMKVEANVDEADIGRIRAGQKAAFVVDAYPGEIFSGEVLQVRKAPQRVESVVSYTVIISVDNSQLKLLPGITALVRITVDEAKNALVVPNAALRFEPPDPDAKRNLTNGRGRENAGSRRHGVWVLDGGGRPVRVGVGIGISNGRVTQISSGSLIKGQQVIVEARSVGRLITVFGYRMPFLK